MYSRRCLTGNNNLLLIVLTTDRVLFAVIFRISPCKNCRRFEILKTLTALRLQDWRLDQSNFTTAKPNRSMLRLCSSLQDLIDYEQANWHVQAPRVPYKWGLLHTPDMRVYSTCILFGACALKLYSIVNMQVASLFFVWYIIIAFVHFAQRAANLTKHFLVKLTLLAFNVYTWM